MSLSAKKIKQRREAVKKLGRGLASRQAMTPSYLKRAFTLLNSSSRQWRENGYKALVDWQQEMSAQGLRGLERADAPTPEMDEGAPWWAIIEDASAGHGGDASVLMGFGPKGAPLPDWMAIVNKAVDSLNRLGEASLSNDPAKGSQRHVKNFARAVSWRETMSAASENRAEVENSLWGGSERAAKLIFNVIVERQQLFSPMRLLKKTFFLSLKKIGEFDHRRSAKRLGALAPKAWTVAFGAFGQTIWESGAGAQILKRKPEKRKEGLLRAIMESMEAGGALSVQLCPNFRELNPMAFKSWEAFVEMDAARLDAVRAAWAIDSSTASLDELKRRSGEIGAEKPKRAHLL